MNSFSMRLPLLYEPTAHKIAFVITLKKDNNESKRKNFKKVLANKLQE